MNITFIHPRISSLERPVKTWRYEKVKDMAENLQRITVRVYYEDTDFSGRVYHASYLRFLERGRTEWLRAFGLQHNDLAKLRSIGFIVTHLRVNFFAPAEIDDTLTIITRLEEMSGALISFQQTILRAEMKIAEGRIDVVTLRNNRPIKPLKEIAAAFPEVKRRSRDRSAR
jgi:acyl-CoA thioester hydrolase